MHRHHDDHDGGEHGQPREGAGLRSRSDPAQAAARDALRVSFGLLKAIMAALVLYYLLLSGLVNIREQEKGVRLRFGKLVGGAGEQVLEPGGPYFVLPYPIEEVVMVPTSPQQLELDQEFWYELTGEELEGKAGPLDPEKDGSLLTGDMNIIHSRWSVTYEVDDVVKYAGNVGDGPDAERLVRMAAQEGVVFAVAGMGADALMKPQNIDAARVRAQGALDEMGTGMRIAAMSLKTAVYPLSVRSAVQAVLNAESERAKQIEEAREERDGILGGTAGEGHGALLALIEEYEAATSAGDAEKMGALEVELDRVLSGLSIERGGQSYAIGGRVAEMMYEAETYRTQVVSQIKNEADYLNSLLPRYRENPSIILNRLWRDAQEEILTGDVETIYLPRGQIYLELNRDPAVELEREKKRMLEEGTGEREKSGGNKSSW
jgi:membrane protease subunit HflK